MAPDASRLAVEELSVRYGSVRAVDAVDLSVGAGEVVALLGPSGCGKSSLLAAVAGLVPHAGQVRIDGTDVAGRRPDQRDLGLMFQDGALFPHLDVGANVAFGLRMHGWERSRRDERVARVLALVGLDGFATRRVHELSGGQAQRVGLARAIAPQPRLLLLDEPLSSLDARLRDHLLEELPAVFAAVDAAVLHVTHDQDEAMALADRVAIMDAGRIVRVDAPSDLWRDPRSVFVAAFLGWHNVFTTSPRRSDGDPAVRGHLPPPAHVRDRLGDPALVGIEAGRLVVGPAGGDPSGDARSGRVVGHRFAGDHVAIDVALDDHDVVVRATGPVHAMPGPGADVEVTVPDDAWSPLVA